MRGGLPVARNEHLGCSAAHHQAKRGLDPETGSLFRRRWLLNAQLRPFGVFWGLPPSWRLFIECRQSALGAVFHRALWVGNSDGFLRFELRAARCASEIRPAGMV